MIADRAPARRWAVGLAALLALAGCTAPATPSDAGRPIGGGSGAGPATPSAAVAQPPAPTAKPSASPQRAADRGDCPSGRWRLRSTEATPGGPVENLSFSGQGAFDLTFDDGDWRLTGNQESPLTATVEIAGFPVSGTAAIDGTARGRYRMVKSAAVFRLERTSGEVDVSYPGGKQTYGMASLAGALVPDGTADLTCRGDSLTIEAENLTLDLRRVKR